MFAKNYIDIVRGENTNPGSNHLWYFISWNSSKKKKRRGSYLKLKGMIFCSVAWLKCATFVTVAWNNLISYEIYYLNISLTAQYYWNYLI